MAQAVVQRPVSQVPLPHVLLVEDHDKAARGIEELLRLEGFRVTRAADGPRALEIAETDRLDAVVLDVMLPGMNGFDVCRALRCYEPTQQVPIVLLTGLSDTPHKLEGLQTGADDYLVKPVPTRELAARLRKLIAGRLERASLLHRQRIQAIGEIAAAVGHEVNNPLAAALGTIDLVLLRDELSTQSRRDLAECRQHLWRIAAILTQLTDVPDKTVPYIGTARMVDLTPEVRG
ncbi:MAG: response regulator [Acidobacteriota bacterium]